MFLVKQRGKRETHLAVPWEAQSVGGARRKQVGEPGGLGRGEWAEPSRSRTTNGLGTCDAKGSGGLEDCQVGRQNRD